MANVFALRPCIDSLVGWFGNCFIEGWCNGGVIDVFTSQRASRQAGWLAVWLANHLANELA
eukprot:15436546-Alexandrium_andersonii.AAC.1